MRKRKMKWAARGMAFLLTFAMVLGGVMVTPRKVSADAIECSLTINKKGATAETPLQGAEFSIYRVINADWVMGGYTVEEAFAEALEGVTPGELGNYSTAELENKIKELKMAAETTEPTAIGVTDLNGVYTFEDVGYGYFLVVETAAPEGYVAGSPFLIAVPSSNNYNDPSAPATNWVYDVVAEPKNAQVSIEKELGETDGTAAVGDFIDYKINTTMANYPDEYFEEEVTFTIKDTMSDGLEIQNTEEHPVVVKVDGVAIEASEGTYTITAQPVEDVEPDLTIAFAKEFIRENRGKTVEVTYFAKITDKAVMGNTGNSNKVTLSYNNKPGEDTATAEAPEVKVYSFGLEVVKFTKEDGTNKTLEGAEFELYNREGRFSVGTATSDENGKLSFPRLDEGTYRLDEIKSPAGYTLLSDSIYVELTAERDAEGQTTGEFTLKVNNKDITTTTGDFVTKLDPATGIATVAVENYKGFTLPATGGMGIAIFLIIGAAGIVVISVMMSRKTKKNS